MSGFSKQTKLLRILFVTTAGLSFIATSCVFFNPADISAISDENAYQAHLSRGWQLVNQREHRKAQLEFLRAEKIEPEQTEPIYGRAKASFHMASYPKALELCGKIFEKPTESYDALGFCWGARLEIGKAAPEIKKAVEREMGAFLDHPDPPPELLYSIYKGYYYLKDREKRRRLVFRLAEMDVGPDLAADIAGSLFEEIITSAPGSEVRIKLAQTYVDNFPDGKMADKAAIVVLRNRQANDDEKSGPLRFVRKFLDGHKAGHLLRGAAAYWLLDRKTGYDYAAVLMEKNLKEFEDYKTESPPHFTPDLWREEFEKKRSFYKYLQGRAWLGMGDPEKAARILDEVISEHQGVWPDAYHFRGLAALGQRQSDQAISYLQKALATGSKRPETEKHLAELLHGRLGFGGTPLAYFQRRENVVKFTDVTKELGLDGVKAMRVAWGDYDNDGDDDLLLDGRELFTNKGADGFIKNGDLLPSTPGSPSGGIWGDYDNDGFLDIFVYSRQGSFLLRNGNGMRFTTAVKLPIGENVFENPEAAAWGDMNNDGFLDLYIANYEDGKVMRGQCGRDRLLINKRGAAFVDLTVTAGATSDENMCGRGVTWSDLNNDGQQDIVVSNYRLDPNFLWFNGGNGFLKDIAESAGVRGHEVEGAYGHSIGSVVGDLDGDLDFDLFLSNLAHPRYIEFSDQSVVLLNSGENMPRFTDNYPNSGISFNETSADPLLFDVDNDGDLDLFITSVYRNHSSHLYLNDGKGDFTDRTWLTETGVDNGWGAAASDYDNDGFLDLLVASPDGARLLHNEGNGNNWLSLRIDDQKCNRFGVGDKVVIGYGGQRQIRELSAGRGTGSQDSLTAHFGLNRHEGPIDISIRTLCGENWNFMVKEPNRKINVINGRPA